MDKKELCGDGVPAVGRKAQDNGYVATASPPSDAAAFFAPRAKHRTQVRLIQILQKSESLAVIWKPTKLAIALRLLVHHGNTVVGDGIEGTVLQAYFDVDQLVCQAV